MRILDEGPVLARAALKVWRLEDGFTRRTDTKEVMASRAR